MLVTIRRLTISNSPSFTKASALSLLVLAIAPVAVRAQSGCAPVPKGLSAWFTFEESRFAQPGTLIPGVVGRAIRLDGKTQFHELPKSTPGLDVGADDFSIEFWLRTSEARRTRSIVDKRDPTPRGYLVFLLGGRIGFQVGSGVDRADSTSKSPIVADGRWHHVAAVCRRLPPQPPTVYVDGELAARVGRNAPLDNIDVETPLWIGRHHRNVHSDQELAYLAGDVDELSFYRRALEPQEAAAIFRAGPRGKCRR